MRLESLLLVILAGLAITSSAQAESFRFTENLPSALPENACGGFGRILPDDHTIPGSEFCKDRKMDVDCALLLKCVNLYVEKKAKAFCAEQTCCQNLGADQLTATFELTRNPFFDRNVFGFSTITCSTPTPTPGIEAVGVTCAKRDPFSSQDRTIEELYKDILAIKKLELDIQFRPSMRENVKKTKEDLLAADKRSRQLKAQGMHDPDSPGNLNGILGHYETLLRLETDPERLRLVHQKKMKSFRNLIKRRNRAVKAREQESANPEFPGADLSREDLIELLWELSYENYLSIADKAQTNQHELEDIKKSEPRIQTDLLKALIKKRAKEGIRSRDQLMEEFAETWAENISVKSFTDLQKGLSDLREVTVAYLPGHRMHREQILHEIWKHHQPSIRQELLEGYGKVPELEAMVKLEKENFLKLHQTTPMFYLQSTLEEIQNPGDQ